MKKLSRPFFDRSTIDVAMELLGKEINFYGKKAIITETEAYIGIDDPACHAARGKTPRTEIMFGKAGFSYVYFIYGMYYCLNFVTEREDFAAAVLIRAVKIEGVNHKLTNGPGKLCRFLGITKEHNKIDVINSSDFFVADIGNKPAFKSTTRIGISKGLDKLWRFVVTND